MTTCMLAMTIKTKTLKEEISQLENNPQITVLCSTYAAGYYDDGYIPLVGPNKLIHLQAGAVIFATGLMEQPAVFRNNDLPGVMLASAAQRLSSSLRGAAI